MKQRGEVDLWQWLNCLMEFWASAIILFTTLMATFELDP